MDTMMEIEVVTWLHRIKCALLIDTEKNCELHLQELPSVEQSRQYLSWWCVHQDQSLNRKQCNVQYIKYFPIAFPRNT